MDIPTLDKHLKSLCQPGENLVFLEVIEGYEHTLFLDAYTMNGKGLITKLSDKITRENSIRAKWKIPYDASEIALDLLFVNIAKSKSLKEFESLWRLQAKKILDKKYPGKLRYRPIDYFRSVPNRSLQLKLYFNVETGEPVDSKNNSGFSNLTASNLRLQMENSNNLNYFQDADHLIIKT